MAEKYDYEVVEKGKEDFKCVICLNLMKDAMQLECVHGLCESCLDDLENDSRKRGVQFCCPHCREEIHREQVYPAKMVDKMILSVKVKCKNTTKGCDWIGELGNMQDHLTKECNFYPVTCPFKPCEEKVERYTLTDHQINCPYKPVACKYCRSTFFISKIQDHHQKCDKYPVECPNSCSEELMERGAVEEHRNVCGKEIVLCEFSAFGCNFTCHREDMSVHNQDVSRHLSLTVKRYHVDMQEMKEKMEQRENLEINFYQEKVFNLVKEKEKWNSIIKDNIDKLFEPSIIAYEKDFGYFVKGLPWLKSKLKEVCERKDQTFKAQYEAVLNEYIEILEQSIAKLKEEVCISSDVWAKIKENIKKEFHVMWANKCKYHIQNLYLGGRLFKFVEQLTPNEMHSIGESRFYKISLDDKRVYQASSMDGKYKVFEDGFLSCSAQKGQFFLSLKKENLLCVIYKNWDSTGSLQECEISIRVNQVFIAVKQHHLALYGENFVIVRFMNRII